jgi:hypothetical protein
MSTGWRVYQAISLVAVTILFPVGFFLLGVKCLHHIDLNEKLVLRSGVSTETSGVISEKEEVMSELSQEILMSDGEEVEEVISHQESEVEDSVALDVVQYIPKNDGVNHLSNLPKEIQAIIANYSLTNISKRDLSALALTNRIFLSIVKSLLPILTNQYLIELFNEIIKLPFNDGIVPQCQILAEKAQSLPILEEKNNAQRNAIASLYEGCGPITRIAHIDKYSLYEDKLLAAMIFTQMNVSEYSYPRFIGSLEKDYHTRTLLAYLNVLKENQLHPDSLYLDLYSPIDNKMVQAIVDVIRNNESISKLNLYLKEWKPSVLKEIVEAINESEFIQDVSIGQLSSNEVISNRNDLPSSELKKVIKQERDVFLTFFNETTTTTLTNIKKFECQANFPTSGPEVHIELNKNGEILLNLLHIFIYSVKAGDRLNHKDRVKYLPKLSDDKKKDLLLKSESLRDNIGRGEFPNLKERNNVIRETITSFFQGQDEDLIIGAISCFKFNQDKLLEELILSKKAMNLQVSS